jgi:tetratricopeptide (TPR) repeat protein
VPLRLALLLVLLFGILVAYLASFNAAGVPLSLGRDWIYHLPLITLLAGAFLVGTALTLVLATLRDLGRSYRGYQRARRTRRAQALHESSQQSIQTQLAGNAAGTSRADEDVPRREATHPAARIGLAELARHQGNPEAALDDHLQTLRTEDRTETLLALADAYRRLGRPDDAIVTYRRVLAGDRDHATAIRGVRDVAAERGRWADALSAQERLVRLHSAQDRADELTWLAGLHYEWGRALLAAGDLPAAVAQFRDALRARPDFVPATLLLGDAHLKAGDTREALRVWERGLEAEPAAPLLARIEQLYRAEGRPARMISLYQDAAARRPDDLSVAFGLGRVYFELAMLDEAAEQFEKLEVRAPELPSIHAHLGAIFERRGQMREAVDEYRRALRFPGAVEWPHRCEACGITQPSWFDRCGTCRRWNTSRS